MPVPFRVVLGLESLLAFLAVFGLFRRGRAGACLSFVAYAASVMAMGLAAVFQPDWVFTWNAWMRGQAVQLALKLAILLELSDYIFRPFPGARTIVRGAVFLVLTATAAALATLTRRGEDVWDYALKAAPVANQGAAWGYLLLLALATWFFVPMDSWRRAILKGMATYAMVFTVAMAALEHLGWAARDFLNYVNVSAFVLLLLYWNVYAWRVSTEEDDDVDRIRREIPLRLAARAGRTS
jgi:hypothetical protein